MVLKEKNLQTALLAIGALALWMTSALILLPGPFYLTGHIQDQIVCLITGYHFDWSRFSLYSPFGFFYHLMAFLSLKIIQLFHLDLAALTLISNLLFSAFLSLVFWLLRRVSANKGSLDFVFLFLLLILSQSLRFLGDLDWSNVYWYGTHNYQMYSLLLMMAYFACKSLEETRDLQSPIPLALAFSLISFFCFHFKMNIFAASLIISLIPSLKMNWRNRGSYFLSYVLLFAALNIPFLFYQNYFSFYFQSLYLAFQAKSRSTIHPQLYFYWLPLLLLLIASALEFNFKNLNLSWKNGRQAIAALLVAAAALLALNGDSIRPFLIILMFYPVFHFSISKPKKTTGPLMALAIGFATLHLLSLTVLLKNKFEATRSKDVDSLILRLPKDDLSISWAFPRENDYLPALIARSKEKESEHLFQMSYLNPDITPGYPFSQKDHLQSIQEALQEFADGKTSLGKSAPTVASLEFVSPFDFLLKQRNPFPVFNWIHIWGTTKAEDLRTIQDYLFQNDFILIRNNFFDRPEQAAMTCQFIQLNRQNKDLYQIVKITPYWTYLKNRNHISNWSVFSESQSWLDDAEEYCRNQP